MLGFHFLKRFRKNRSGVAAVEFALFAPMMAAAFVLSLDVALNIVNRMRMEAAVRAGVQYLMEDGRDMTVLENVVRQSWSPIPSDATVRAVRYCQCSDISHVCNTLCADDSAPESYFTVEVSGTLHGFLGDTVLSTNEQVRVR